MARDRRPPKTTNKRTTPAGRDPVAKWYDGWVGQGGSEHHRKLAIPAVLDLLDLREDENVLDMGCGQGVLAPFVKKAGAKYTGVDVSKKLLELARQHHGRDGRFLQIDARYLSQYDDFKAGEFDALVFLLSIQDMDPLSSALRSASWALRPGGQVVILMTHPSFRIPRQSGWGWDEGRKLQFRRVDRYLTPLSVPMKTYPGESGATISFHRPLNEYINGSADNGLLTNCLEEIPTSLTSPTATKAEMLAEQEIPLFLGLRARKLG